MIILIYHHLRSNMAWIQLQQIEIHHTINLNHLTMVQLYLLVGERMICQPIEVLLY